MREIFPQQASKKRKLSNVVLCYHGCVLARADSLIFRQHIDDIKNQVIDLLQAGYRFVAPSEYDDWYEGMPGYDAPLAVIHLDDGLDSIIPLCEWLIDRQLPFGVAVISSRNNKYNPQQGFLRWSTLKAWVDSGFCQILRHTHNIHNLTIHSVDGYAAPVLEGPCWIDEPADILYLKPGDTRWYWDYSIIDKTTWGFPLLGSDPYSDYTTPITADIQYVASVTTTVNIIRFWAALHRPAGAGYACNVEVIADGVSLGIYTISPKNYETRTQWVEREFYTLPLTVPFSITAGTTHTLQFVTQNTGPGVFILYVLPDTDDTRFQCVTSCQSLTPGKKGPDYADFPAGRPWPGRAGLILASGSGRQATMAEYQGYIQADTDAQTNAIETWLRADWHETLNDYNTARTRWSVFPLAGCDAVGSRIKSIIKWTARRPSGFDPLATELLLQCLRLRQLGPSRVSGTKTQRYALLVRIEIAASASGPWTQVGEWVPGWDYYKWVTIDIDPVVVPVNAVRFFRFTSLTRGWNADYITVEDPHDRRNMIPATNAGLITVQLDMPFVNEAAYTRYFDEQGNEAIYEYYRNQLPDEFITVDDMSYPQFIAAYGSFYPGFSLIDNAFKAMRKSPFSPTSMSAFSSTVAFGDPWRVEEYPDQILVGATYNGTAYVGYYGNLLFGALASTHQPSGITYDQMIYPFGSFSADSSPTADIKPVLGISDELQSVFDDAGIRSGYTIWPSRNDVESRFREPFCRCTSHTKSRMLLYGDVLQENTRSLIANYTGLRWPDAGHGGIKWQLAIEPDNNGNATIRHCYAALDTVAFDAYFFRMPDVDHADGWIQTGALNDGGTYDGVVFADDKSFLRARGVHCSLIVSNFDADTGDISPTIASFVVNNPSTFIPLITALAADWDGITCNLEGIPQSDRAAATAFYQDLGRALRAIDTQLHITAPARTNTDYDIGSEWWWGWCDHAAIIGYVDRMKIMSYTETGPGTPPGPHAPDWFVDSVYRYIAATIPPEHFKRILVGVNAFGHIWYDENGASVDYGSSHACMAQAITRGSKIQFTDGEAHFSYQNMAAWWSVPPTINRAVDIATRFGFGGVGVWKGDDGDIDEHYPRWPQIGIIDMTSFIDIRFPDDIRYGFSGGPMFKVDVGASDGGGEQRNLRWDVPLYEYAADMRVVVSEMGHAGLDDLVAFFRMAKGRYHSFRFKDHADFRATDSHISTADGSTTAFQLRKTYQYGSEIEYRTITKPVFNSVVVKVNGSIVTNYTVNYTTGIIVFDTPPANGSSISASFEFDVQVRFNMDKLPIVINSHNTLDVQQIQLVEVRE